MIRSLTTIIVLCALITSAQAQDPRMGWDKAYSRVGGWTIGFNSARGHCFAAAKYNGGMVLFMGVDNVRKNGVIGFFNKRWGNITDGHTYKIQYRFGRRRWNGPATGATTRFGRGYYAQSLKLNFIEEIARSAWIEIRRGRQRLGRVSLRGTRNALNATVECQRTNARTEITVSASRKTQDRLILKNRLPFSHELIGKWSDGQYGGCSDEDGKGFFVITPEKFYAYDLECAFRRILISKKRLEIDKECSTREAKLPVTTSFYQIITKDKIEELIGNSSTTYKRCKK